MNGFAGEWGRKLLALVAGLALALGMTTAALADAEVDDADVEVADVDDTDDADDADDADAGGSGNGGNNNDGDGIVNS
ncbi:MAG: hypothetical protein M3Q10_20760 [Chloroflexota bacterium]|nr:hypothetical protein [Chloroflexota bacterium]